MLCKDRWGWGATGGMWKTVESVKMVSVYLSLQNNKIKVTVSNKYEGESNENFKSAMKIRNNV
jgi:hypothetical protein